MSPNFKQTDIGSIPDDWEVIHLDEEDYFETLNGLWKGKKAPFVKINVLRNTNFTNSGKLDYSDVAELDVEIKQYEKRKLLCGDIIIERSGGGPTQPVGRVVFFDKPNGEFSFSNFTSTLRVKKPEEIHHKFLFYSLLSFYFSGRTYALQGRTTGIRNLDFNKYKTTAGIPKLPFSEQCKIAHILSKIQQAIEKQEQIIKTTQELKKALMQKLFTEGVNNEPQRQSVIGGEIGLIPKSWEVVTINEILSEELKNGAFIKSPEYGVGHLFVNVVDIYRNAILNISLLARINVNISEIEKYLLQKNDIVFVRSSLKRDGIGESCLILGCDEPLFFDCHLIRIRPDTTKIDPLYLVYFWRSPTGKKELIKRSKTTTMTTINQQNLSNALFPLPSLSVQKEISIILSSLDTKIEFHNKNKTQLQDLFKTMLTQLMSGQLRVKDIDLSALADLKVPSREGI